jgi:hypothetical protein
MKIRLSRHMQEQLADRPELRREWIEAAMISADWSAPDPDPGLVRSYKSIAAFGNRVLSVVHRRTENDILVVTAHF